jgi:hypothetical protein
MLFDDPLLFEQAAQELLPHLTHKISVMSEGGDAAPDAIDLICDDCNAILLNFAPKDTATEQPDPKQVAYEGHYDAHRDVCYVEVFKPSKAPYPLQERQDLINHSPTGISWGYGGSGPAQAAFAILMDYLGDEARARALYQDFKFRVIAAFSANSDWILTGAQIENALVRIGHGQQHS